MNASNSSQWPRVGTRLWKFVLCALAIIASNEFAIAQCPHQSSGQLKGCSKCGRYWVEQNEPFVLYSEESSSIHGPTLRHGVPQLQPVVRPTSAWQLGRPEGTPPSVALPSPYEIGALPPATPDPERWLSENSEPPLFAAGPPQAGEWYETIAAEPDDCPYRLSFRDDISHAWVRFKSDFAGVLQPNNLLILGVAAGGAVGIHQDWDDNVREWTRRHPNRWGDGTDILSHFGDVEIQVPVIAATYFWSLHRQDAELHDFTRTLMSAYWINGLSTLALKGAVNSQRPSADFNGGQFGFPSFHTSSTFTIASVLNEYYGWQVGVPSFALAGLVGWSRIDSRHHDVSDVFFGAALGYVIGTSVAKHHLTGDSRVMLLPWNEPSNRAVGLAMEWRY